MRVLHLIDAAGPQAASATLAMIADALGRLGHIDQQVVLLGGSHLADAAIGAGLGEALRIGAPFGHALLAAAQLRRRLRAAAKRNGSLADPTTFDLVHCWSIGALTAAALLYRSTPRLFTVTTPPTRRAVRWLRVLGAEAAGRTTLLAISSTIRRTLISGGLPETSVHVLRPAIDMSRIDAAARDAIRESWGIHPKTNAPIDPPRPGSRLHGAAENAPVKVVALLGDPPVAADALAGGLATVVAAQAMAGEPVQLRLLVHPRQRNLGRVERMMRDVRWHGFLIEEARLAQPWSILPGCDLALAPGIGGAVRVSATTGEWRALERPMDPTASQLGMGGHRGAEAGGGGLSLLWAMAANVPIVGEATYGISEIVEDRHSALLARPGDNKALAHRIRQLLTDPHLAWQMRDMARHEAYSFFSRRRYCESIRAVYEQVVAGRPVEVPAIQVTGGLRFTGRA